MSSNTTSTGPNQADIDKLREIIKSGDGDPSTWDQAWQANITPWDAGQSQPPLRDLIDSNIIDFPHRGRALVPGCGAGYDAIYIASALTLDTYGMDAAPTAITKAQAILESAVIPSPGKVTFQLTDFFSLAPESEEERFDIIYDYTFFVAIPPAKRSEWARLMTSLIKPGGHLITLIYPIVEETDLGPPFFVRVEHYEALLNKDFVKVVDKVPETSSEAHVGKERIVVWRRL